MTTTNQPSPPPPPVRPFQVVRGHGALGERPQGAGAAVAIGNFDGVHLGHQRLFAEAVSRARALGLGGPATVLTFDPHPARLLSPRYAPPLITTPERKLELIAASGVDLCVVEPFDRALAALSPEEFVERVVVRALGARHVCVGYDFTFGKDRRGGPTLLRELGAALGFELTVVDPVTASGIVCSSTKVREFVLEGRVEGAALLLGRDVEIDGEVVHGAGRGRTIGVPTANLRPRTELLPRGGVYAGWAELRGVKTGAGEAVSSNGGVTRWDAAINIGTNPTFTGAQSTPNAVDGSASAPALSVEAHLLDYQGGDLHGAGLRLGLSARLRDELRFPSVDLLIDQIRRDIGAAREAGLARRSAQASAVRTEVP